MQTALRATLIEDAATRLLDAERSVRRIAPLTKAYPDLSEPEAYAIAARTFALRRKEQVGYKLGYTSAAMRAQMKIDRPNYGRLAAGTEIRDAGTVDGDRLVHPLIEPEIALRTRADLHGHPDAQELRDAIDAVMPSLEIVDTRYRSYRFEAVDNIADNSSSARFVLGPPRPLKGEDLALTTAELAINGQVVAGGIGADALGSPLTALAWLVERLAAEGSTLPAGSIILTGGLTRAYPVMPGQAARASFSDLGQVGVQF